MLIKQKTKESDMYTFRYIKIFSCTKQNLVSTTNFVKTSACLSFYPKINFQLYCKGNIVRHEFSNVPNPSVAAFGNYAPLGKLSTFVNPTQ